MKKMVIMRGLPGMGKSALVRSIVQDWENNGGQAAVFSTDDFWGPDYKHDSSRLKEAHAWNEQRCRDFCQAVKTRENREKLLEVGGRMCDSCYQAYQEALKARKEILCVIDNCNLRKEHIQPYSQIAEENDFTTTIQNADQTEEGSFFFNVLRREIERSSMEDGIVPFDVETEKRTLAAKLALKNVHQVPEERLLQMIEIFEF